MSDDDGQCPSDKPTCDNCRFWTPCVPALAGFCRRFPPFDHPSDGGDDGLASSFPTTHAKQWCGEHQPEEKPAK